jgi:hypothetical protein
LGTRGLESKKKRGGADNSGNASAEIMIIKRGKLQKLSKIVSVICTTDPHSSARCGLGFKCTL